MSNPANGSYSASLTTPQHGFPYLMPAQAQKHITVNQSLSRLDALIDPSVIDQSVAPPASPSEGDMWLVDSAGTGEWAGHDLSLAQFIAGAWCFFAPRIGQRIYHQALDCLCIFTGQQWQPLQDTPHFSSPETLGINTLADSVNRLAVKSDSVLLSHDDVTPGTGNLQLALNKATPASTNEIVFQDNYSGRAAIGLSGNDYLSFKLSSDGSIWTTALTINPVNGGVTVNKFDALESISLSGDTWRTNRISVASDNAWSQIQCRRARGSQSVPEAVKAGDTIFSLSPMAYNGAEYKLCGGLSFLAGSDFSSRQDAYMRIATLDDGAWTEQMRISATGDMGIGTALPVTKLDVAGPVRPKSYSVSTLPSATEIAGGLIFVNDEAGGAVPAFSDGTNWRRVTDRAIVS